MADFGVESRLLERYQRAVREPRLMMLYPPISTGHHYDGAPGADELWRESPATGTLYVHVPFCRTRCGFCPFFAEAGRDHDYDRYAKAVLAEADLFARGARHLAFTSVYLGGGTPALLPPATVASLLDGLRRRFWIEGADVMIEAHPASVDATRLAELSAAGVTRVSIGVQSFDPEVLRACGRADTVDRVRPAVEAALGTQMRDVNVDLMYGLPGQTAKTWAADLRAAVGLGIPGLTLYATVYLPAFRRRCKSRRLRIPPPGARWAMCERAFEFLNAAGYPQPHFGANAFLRGGLNPHRRNVALGLPTLGLGSWAYSSSGAFAYHNHSPLEVWLRDVERGRLPIRQVLAVPEAERARKYVIEALLLAYLDLSSFRQRFGMDLAQAFPVELALLGRLGLATIEDGELRLTRRGGRHLREIRYLFASERVVEVLETAGAGGL